MPLIATRGAASAQGFGEFAQPAGPANYIEDNFSTYIYSGNGGSETIVNNVNLLTSGSSATTGTDIGSSLGAVSVASDGSYAVTAGNAVLKITATNTLDWQRGDTSVNFMNCVIDSSGNVYAIGYSGSTAYFCKYNSSGTQQWFKSCSSTAPDDVMGMEITSDGNLFLGWGATSGTAVSMKVDSSNGSILWQKLLTDTSLKCQDVATDSSGNCYQYGYAGSTRYPFIVKYDSSGNVTWQRKLTDVSATGLYSYGIGVDSSGNVFAACYLGSGGTNKSFIVKLDSSGSLTAQRGSTATNSTSAVCLDSSGNVYYSSGSRIFKYNNSLTFQWVRTISSGGPVRSGLSTSSTQLYATANSGPVFRLNIDGTTVQGVSSVNSGITYTNPASTDNASTSISASAASISFSSGSYSVSNYTPANDTSYTATAQLFPEIPASGGLVWIKTRNVADSNYLFDTSRGTGYYISSNTTGSQGGGGSTTLLNAFNRNGFSIGSAGGINGSGEDLVSWTFREQSKFFDVVTYTGNGTNGRAISHALASSPGCVIIKSLNNSGTGYDGWYVRHRSATGLLYLNLTNAQEANFGNNITALSSTTVTVGGDCNENGETYVMYLFAHDAGGFGLTGSDNVISCGSFATNGSGGATVTLNYEPQWILFKNVSAAENWVLVDTMRGLSVAGSTRFLRTNTTDAESGLGTGAVQPTATGFVLPNSGIFASSNTYIYIAIRRGPMKTPTTGTSVFSPVASSASTGTTLTTNFPIDMQLSAFLSGYSNNTAALDRLRGVSSTTTETVVRLTTSSTGAESASGIASRNWSNTGFEMPSALGGGSSIFWNFRRAPGFFDVVCYTGTGSTGLSVSHNLGVMPELIIIKRRDASVNWAVGTQFASSNFTFAFLNTTGAGYVNQSYNTSYGFYAQPTSTAFTLDTASSVNSSAGTYVAYLFASVSGVSKVGSYTGTGALQTVNCGFTGGARFVLIKRTDSTGDWWVYDSARGISSGNDPYLFLNSTAAEVTNTNYVDTTSVGFQVTAAAPAGLNANGGTYIFLAIA